MTTHSTGTKVYLASQSRSWLDASNKQYKYCTECCKWVRSIRMNKHLVNKHGKIFTRY